MVPIRTRTLAERVGLERTIELPYNGFRVHPACAEGSRIVVRGRSASSDRDGWRVLVGPLLEAHGTPMAHAVVVIRRVPVSICAIVGWASGAGR